MKFAQRIQAAYCHTGAAALLLVATTLLTAPSTAMAQSGDSEIWICTDAESGSKTFTSNPRGLSNCRRADPSGATRAARPAAAPSNAATGAGSTASAKAAARTSAPVAALTGLQRQRESDRKQILQDELAFENKKLAELQHEYNQGAPQRLPGETDDNKYRDRKQRLSQDVERSRVNIRSLARELERL